MNFNLLVDEFVRLLKDDDFVLTYAFNAVGKTRISKELTSRYNTDEDQIEKSICYNAFLEDYFTWDNENCIFQINESWLTKIIIDEGLYSNIIDTFKETVDKKIEPKFDLANGTIEFIMPHGDSVTDNIKISKGEETIFKWVIFYVVLENAIDQLIEKLEDRSTHVFDNLEHIIIDDPVSSIDDYRIYTISVRIIKLLRKIREKNLNISVLISTHHALFFNILYSFFQGKRKNHIYFLMVDENDYVLERTSSNMAFSFHGAILKEIKKALDKNTIEKKHFNLMRSVVEKTASFLGYYEWGKLFDGFNKSEELVDMLNNNSHSKNSEMEMRKIAAEQATLFKDGFDFFIKKYSFNIR